MSWWLIRRAVSKKENVSGVVEKFKGQTFYGVGFQIRLPLRRSAEVSDQKAAASPSSAVSSKGCISWEATSGGWPLRVRKFRVEYDWNHAKFVWTCGADVRGRPTLVFCDRCAGACLQAKAGLGDTTWRHLTDSFFSFSFLLDFGGSQSLGGVFRSWRRSFFGDRRLLAYSVMTVVACWTGCVDGRHTWSQLRSSATWKDGLSGGGKRGAGEGHLKRELR